MNSLKALIDFILGKGLTLSYTIRFGGGRKRRADNGGKK